VRRCRSTLRRTRLPGPTRWDCLVHLCYPGCPGRSCRLRLEAARHRAECPTVVAHCCWQRSGPVAMGLVTVCPREASGSRAARYSVVCGRPRPQVRSDRRYARYLLRPHERLPHRPAGSARRAAGGPVVAIPPRRSSSIPSAARRSISRAWGRKLRSSNCPVASSA
jgi:hypothetical protein